ncbi:15077_t:CDS:2, partial [Acaulospora morrowiae]
MYHILSTDQKITSSEPWVYFGNTSSYLYNSEPKSPDSTLLEDKSETHMGRVSSECPVPSTSETCTGIFFQLLANHPSTKHTKRFSAF